MCLTTRRTVDSCCYRGIGINIATSPRSSASSQFQCAGAVTEILNSGFSDCKTLPFSQTLILQPQSESCTLRPNKSKPKMSKILEPKTKNSACSHWLPTKHPEVSPDIVF